MGCLMEAFIFYSKNLQNRLYRGMLQGSMSERTQVKTYPRQNVLTRVKTYPIQSQNIHDWIIALN